MNRKRMIRTALIAGLFFLALGGWLLHLRIHPLKNDEENIIPLISCIVSVFVIPLLFASGWYLTWPISSVIIGTITMAHFSIVHFQGPATVPAIILNTTFADIAILWGKFAIGKAVFDLEYTDAVPKHRFFRYPNMGWWWAHLFALATVYFLGNIFWK